MVAAIIWSVLPSSHAKALVASRRPLQARFTPSNRTSFVFPGTLDALPWPSPGEGAVAIAGAGLMASSANEKVVPIASLTKMMTAYIILHDHPLKTGADGPSFTMTQADVDAWIHASQSGYSNIQVKKGEVLSEHQLLEALLVPSADNIADYLGAWDAKTDAGFVVKMNATARKLGLTSTHYADASGVNPGSRSNAEDQARLAAALMNDPAVRSIVAHPSLPFPVMGTIRNYNPALGVDGIIGVKSGYTSAAQGCLATAAFEQVDGQSVLLISVALGQVDGLYGAARADEKLTVAGAKQLVALRPARSGATVGSVSIGGGAAVPVVITGPDPVVVGWPGMKITESLSLAPSVSSGGAPAVATSTLGSVLWTTPTGVVGSAPFASATPTAPPTTAPAAG